MSFEQEVRDLESYFADNWSDTPVKYENTQLNDEDLSEFVSMTFLSDEARIASRGTNTYLYRYFGIVVNQVFVKPNSGTRRAMELIEKIIDLWTSFSQDGLTVSRASMDVIGVRDGWFQINVSHETYRDTYAQRSAV